MNASQRQALKALAHHLKPIVLMGAKGLTDAVTHEVHVGLLAHELIKVKMSGTEKSQRTALLKELCDKVHADVVQLIGHTAVLYRENTDDLLRS